MTHSAPEELPLSDGLDARNAALILIDAVLVKKQFLDIALERTREYSVLEQRDRAFCRMIVSIILRHKGQMDELITRALDKGQNPRPETIRHILYLGMAQLFFMDVADHAAIDTSVTLAERLGHVKQKGFVNAVLRRMQAEGREWLKNLDPVQTNIPHWLLSRWIEQYGLSETAQIAQALLSEAPLDITVKHKGELKMWEGALEAVALPTGSLRRMQGGRVQDLAGYETGSWWVQDAAAALPVNLLGDLQDKYVIDLCAAPGGKTMQLAAAGAQVIAVDRSPARTKLVHENLARMKLTDNVECVIADGAEWIPPQPPDLILLDAPCTASGTIRRHPDLLHLKEEKDLQSLAGVQQSLLNHAAEILKPGGTLMYCTCSLLKEEGEYQIDNFLAGHPDFQRLSFAGEEDFALEPLLTPEGDLRILPYHLSLNGGMDGFFVSRLRKK